VSAWILLGFAIVAEVVATVALRMSAGLTRPIATGTVIVGYVAAFWLLSRVVLVLAPSVTYAVWAGVGISLVAIAGVLVFGEAMTWPKVVSLILIVFGVVGLSLFGDPAHHSSDASSEVAS
jgi:small multidrug resistance pump